MSEDWMSRKKLSFHIETNRLKLILPSLKYKKAVFNGLTKEVTTYMYPVPFKSVKRAKKFINYFRQWYINWTDVLLLVIRKSDSKFLWCVGLHDIKKTDPGFGIRFCSRAHWKWYAIESLRSLYERWKNNLNYEYLKYPVDRRNIASRKIAEKLGWVIVCEYPMVTKTWKELDVVEYRIWG